MEIDENQKPENMNLKCAENYSSSESDEPLSTFSKGTTFRWPEKPDIIWYQHNDVMEQISKPVLTNK